MSIEALKTKKVAIIAHVYSPGPPHELEAFLYDKVAELYFVAHPIAVKNRPSTYRRWVNGRLVSESSGLVWPLPDILRYLKDFLANLFLLMTGPRYDLIIALNNLNTASALWLRALGKTKQVVFYTIDYIPQRFPNRLLNTFYHQLDAYGVRQADYVWNLSPVMTEMRSKRGLARYRAKQLVVPIGTHLLPKGRVKKDPNVIVFMGHLRAGQGIELLLEAMPEVLRQQSSAKLRLIGGGPLEGTIKTTIRRLKLGRSVELTGFLPTNEAMRRALLEGAIAVAPYVDDAATYTRYTDPGKPKEYLAAGLPVIITRVPQFAEVIAARQAGKTIAYDRDELAQAIIELLSSPQLERLQDNARRLAAEYHWDKIFTTAFKEMK